MEASLDSRTDSLLSKVPYYTTVFHQKETTVSSQIPSRLPRPPSSVSYRVMPRLARAFFPILHPPTLPPLGHLHLACACLPYPSPLGYHTSSCVQRVACLTQLSHPHQLPYPLPEADTPPVACSAAPADTVAPAAEETTPSTQVPFRKTPSRVNRRTGQSLL